MSGCGKKVMFNYNLNKKLYFLCGFSLRETFVELAGQFWKKTNLIQEDPCKKKEDACKKKEDPCKKKEDPCKKKEDPCKKKEDACPPVGKAPECPPNKCQK